MIEATPTTKDEGAGVLRTDHGLLELAHHARALEAFLDKWKVQPGLPLLERVRWLFDEHLIRNTNDEHASRARHDLLAERGNARFALVQAIGEARGLANAVLATEAASLAELRQHARKVLLNTTIKFTPTPDPVDTTKE